MSLLTAAALCGGVLGSIITIDDNGPADYSSIGAAIAAAAPGDILIVAPGAYAPFTLEKLVKILGKTGLERVRVGGTCTLRSTQGFTVAGIDFRDLVVQQCHGRAIVDDCTVGSWTASAAEAALWIEDCDQVEVSRCTARGRDGKPDLENGRPALHVQRSAVTVVDCALRGGDGKNTPGPGGSGTDGAAGFLVEDGSSVVVAGSSSIVGGRAGWGDCGLSLPCYHDGRAGDGIRVAKSQLSVRGAPPDAIVGGDYDPEFGGEPGYAILAGSASLAWSGVSAELDTFCTITFPCPPPVFAAFPSTIISPASAEPFLEIRGVDGPDAARQVELHGPAGEIALLFAAAKPGKTQVPGLAGPLWLGLDPTLVVLPLTTLGQGSPVVVAIPVPAGAEALALTLHAQAVFPGIPDALEPAHALVTNVANLVPRP